MTSLTLRLGTRPSKLALAQAQWVKQAIEQRARDVRVELVPIRTTGDRLTRGALSPLGGKGLFVRELEQALRDGKVDLSVHSMKDLPAVLAPDFRIVAVSAREDVRDAIVTTSGADLDSLPLKARLGTSSLRRKFIALRMRPDLEVITLRGNVDSRLAKLEAGQFDAIILAVAGLKRMANVGGAGLDRLVAADHLGQKKISAGRLSITPLDEHRFVPAAGQGALALEALADKPVCASHEIEALLSDLNDSAASIETTAERSFLASIGASCVSPVGVCARFKHGVLAVKAILFNREGSKAVEAQICAFADRAGFDPSAVGRELGQQLLANGGWELLGDG